MSKFPNAKVQVWINDVSQIKGYVGVADYIVLFNIDNDILGTPESGWPSFRLANIENEIKTIYKTKERSR